MRRLVPLLLIVGVCPIAAREIPSSRVIVPVIADAEILIDPWGIAHIYAQNDDDLFYLQGWNAARDRLWQIDLWRRRGLGQMSAVFGTRYLEQDRAARLFLYRGELDAEWKSYGPDAKRIAARFVEGINAYIGEVLRIDRTATAEFKALHREYRLPPEFRVLNYRPAFWSVDDIVRIRAHGLSGNARNEVDRARFVCRFGIDAEVRRRPPHPHRKLTLPSGLDPCTIPRDVLDLFELATSELSFTDVPTAGSNNWAIGPQRTTTGRPILANDPHRALTLPSLRYAVHLNSPALNVIGAGEPFLPGISIGHNGTAAFGLTRFYIDQEDLYIYETKAGDANRYRYGAAWEPMRVVREKIGDHSVELKFTRHGPVIREDPANRRAYALRAAWLGPGTLPYFGAVQTMRAREWATFVAALQHWGSPGLNHVYADTQGTIGWKAWGRAPVRKNWDGLFPVPGDGRYEWQGYYSLEDLPSEHNPERGWIATANQMNIPPQFQEKNLGFEWMPPWRQHAIEHRLAVSDPQTVADSVETQTGFYSTLSVHLMRWFSQTLERNGTMKSPSAELLAGFHGQLVPHSPGAALYVVWKRHVWRLVGERLLPQGGRDGFAAPTDTAVLSELEAMPVQVRDEIFLASLVKADEDLLKTLGPTRTDWALGQLQRMRFDHPLSKVSKEIARLTSQANHEYPRGGDASTINVTSVRDGIHRNGASWRMVIDVGSWDDSRAINAPGQSGDPMSVHFADLYSRWATDQMFPLLYSREAIEAAAEHRITVTNR